MRPFIALPNYCGDGAPNHSGVIVSRDSEACANSEIRRRELLLLASMFHKDPPTLISSPHSELENWRLGNYQDIDLRFKSKHSTAMLLPNPANASAQCHSILRPSEKHPVITAILMESSKPLRLRSQCFPANFFSSSSCR